MPRTAGMIVPDAAAVQHVALRTALDGFPIGNVEKILLKYSYLPPIIWYYIFGFALVGIFYCWHKPRWRSGGK